VNLSARDPKDRPPPEPGVAAPDEGPLSLVRRLLHRKDSAELTSLASPSSTTATSPRQSVVDRLENLLTHDLPSSMEVLPKNERAPSRGSRVEVKRSASSASERGTAKLKEDPVTSSEFVAVRSVRLAAKDAIVRCQDAYQEIEANLRSYEREFERRNEALSSIVESMSANLHNLRAKVTKDVADELEKASQASQARSATQLEERAEAAAVALEQQLSSERERFVAEIQKHFEELRAAKQAFVDETQKHLTVTKSSLESLAKDAVEKARGELDASKRALIDESQEKLASISQTFLEPLADDLSRDVVEQVRAELTASRQEFVAETQQQLAEVNRSLQGLQSLTRATIEQANADLLASGRQFIEETPKQVAAATQALLESVVKTTVERGCNQLAQMVDTFLAKGIPEIDAEIRRFASRHSSAVPTQVAPPRIADLSRPLSIRPALAQGQPLEFTVAESARRREIEAGEVWTGLRSGLKVGLGLGVMVLFMVAIYISSSPVIRLRPKPPDTFFDDSPSWTAHQRARENQLARAYWGIAVNKIETKYGFGTTLPADPPEDFVVQEKASPEAPAMIDADARTRYWGKLREVWPLSDSWERISDWNLEWIRNAWGAVSSRVTQVFSGSQTSAAPAP
jgi:hypothetical protein